MWFPKKSTLVDTMYQHSVPCANSWGNEFGRWRWKEVVKFKFCWCIVVVMIFKTWFSILDYCLGPMPESCLPGVTLTPCFKVVLIVALLQMVTYYLWWVLWYFKEFKNAKLDKWQKMLLSLRSNPQTMSPYIHESDGLCTRTDHHILLPIVLHMVVPLC